MRTLLTIALLAMSAPAMAANQIVLNDDDSIKCYNGYSFDALFELLQMDFDPALDESEAYVTDKGALIAPQYDEEGYTQQIITVPPCDGNKDFNTPPVTENKTPSEKTAEMSFSCFETMATIYSNGKPMTGTWGEAAKIAVAKAEKDAVKRAKKSNQNLTPVSYVVSINNQYVYGIKVVLAYDENDEYADYFLYSVENTDVQLLSAHLGDDQGPELKNYCTGWNKGIVVE